ncbi:hypothetical protein NUJ28_08315 [Burkholderia multivorans]|uniref:hypothetical protein n=1 Tax=Burkholderia multivorans TaxID=87883 RepID=UPI0021D89D7C|nr:hypothetical protein [Burkholderia multivorans]UXZ62697.1 hypothetical protein NUJ28_08315 [Burkholderia multivorans]
MQIYVAFSDRTEVAVIASFGCAQDPKVWPYQGVIDDSDSRWGSYVAQFVPGTFEFYNSGVAPVTQDTRTPLG